MKWLNSTTQTKLGYINCAGDPKGTYFSKTTRKNKFLSRNCWSIQIGDNQLISEDELEDATAPYSIPAKLNTWSSIYWSMGALNSRSKWKNILMYELNDLIESFKPDMPVNCWSDESGELSRCSVSKSQFMVRFTKEHVITIEN